MQTLTRASVLLPRTTRPAVVAPACRTIRVRFSSSAAEPRTINVIDIPAPTTGRIRILSLNRPKARNAISRQLLAELRENVRAVAAEYDSAGNEITSGPPTRALVIASEVESCFCAGADLKERAGMSQDETAQFLYDLRSTFTSISDLPIPTISAISSLALGGGLELALTTHMRVLASTASVGLPETRLGIIPGAGGTYRLPAIIGLSRARDLILTGRRVSAAEAYFLGIADRLIEVTSAGKHETPEELMRRAGKEVLAGAVSLASDICEGGPIAIRAALEAVSWAQEERENMAYEKVVGTDDRNEALAAFREKRKPAFKGR